MHNVECLIQCIMHNDECSYYTKTDNNVFNNNPTISTTQGYAIPKNQISFVLSLELRLHNTNLVFGHHNTIVQCFWKNF